MTVYKITKVEFSREEEKMFEQVTDALNGYLKKKEILPSKIYNAAKDAHNAIENFTQLVKLCEDYVDEYENETEEDVHNAIENFTQLIELCED